MTEQPTRSYVSPLREEQTQRTKDRILDAVTELLADHRADEITTRQIAEGAGVSQPTVYRHYPDRAALIEGVATRLDAMASEVGHDPAISELSEVGAMTRSVFHASDALPVEATADAVLNADPRRYGSGTRERTEMFVELVGAEFPRMGHDQVTGLAALLRCLGSSQTWLRMREEFGVPGVESGPLAAWAIDTLIAEARRGTMPTVDGSDAARAG